MSVNQSLNYFIFLLFILNETGSNHIMHKMTSINGTPYKYLL